MTKEKTKPLYKVIDLEAPSGTLPRLVRGASRPVVRSYVTRNRFVVTIASQDDIADLIEKGVRREDATLEPEEDAENGG